MNVLKEIALFSQSALEQAESVEQLRWLENGNAIKAGITQLGAIGVDTSHDFCAKALCNITVSSSVMFL